MKAILELKEMSNGYYKECEKGVKYIRNDVYTNLEAHLIRENNKLCERLRKKNEKIKELKQELKNKEQRDMFFQKMHEAGYEWDTEKKELKKIEQSELTEFEEVEKVEFTGRFQKPDWYAEAEK